MKHENVQVRQFQYENEAAHRLLEFLLQENVILKTRLAEVLRDNAFPTELMVTVEQFQEWLLQKDAVIALMRQEAAELEKTLARFLHEDGTLKVIVHNQKKLRKDLKTLGLAFSDLRSQFNSFIESL
ncbi:hypothetical protein [Paraflavitalea pollutisoli]|uniref:hypothetical protein n=1 Tax=Paraflavitalea pollutisoli TaxID=3034143 RepID=UPI0023EB0937|nr:hypothetical protein [Paraflavitalea sp. H1-2-19X]